MSPKADLAKLSFEELARVRASLVDDIGGLEKELKEANAEIIRRLDGKIQDGYRERNIQHGLIRFEHEGVQVAVEIRKTVKWDQDDLTKLSNKLPPEAAARIFDVELAIPEKILEAMARTDLPLYTSLNQARTVKYSAPSIKQIELPEAKQ